MTSVPGDATHSHKGAGRDSTALRLLLLGLLLVLIAATACAVRGSHETASGSKDQPGASARSRSNLPNPFTVTDTFEPSALGLHHPIALAIGPNGDVYVTEPNQEVAMISPAGKVLRRWGNPGRGPSEFNFLKNGPSDWHASIAIDPDGHVYVVDSGNYRVQVFSATGEFLSKFGSQGESKGQFLSPNNLAVDNERNAYVADEPTKTISKFSATGHFVWRIGGFASSEPDIQDLGVFASVDSHGRLVAAHADDGTILYIDGDGHEVEKFEVPTSPCDMTVDSAGNTFLNGICGGAFPGADTTVYDRTHRLVGVCSDACPFWSAPRFGPHGEAFALGKGGTILKLKITLP